MQCNDAQLIFFSPTKTTMQIVDYVADGLGCGTSRLDLTFPAEDVAEAAGDLAIIGVPVYAGRAAGLAVERLKERVRGDGRPAVLVVVYGNRDYEDALIELRDLAVELGFVPVAAGAFIGQHTYSSDEKPVAPGRPDGVDATKASDFGAAVAAKLGGIEALDAMPELTVPGNFPYRDGTKPNGLAPVTLPDLCTLCGECAKMCPSQVITVTDEAVETDGDNCIRCAACIRACPTQARVWDSQKIADINDFLYTKCSARREPETFL
ncbi:4Fe-4S binding protein [Pseudodesulfovibrio sp.]|uniref:4Fe-4S binding protein n=1 Tax=unclassified Pseudodesulfovibrio TaxID=2661612 RepID=UPI003B00007C